MAITAESIPGYVAGTWKIDAAHTEIGFVVRHLAISKVRAGTPASRPAASCSATTSRS